MTGNLLIEFRHSGRAGFASECPQTERKSRDSAPTKLAFGYYGKQRMEY